MILLFLLLLALHANLYTAQEITNEDLIDEMRKLRQIVKFLESNMEEQRMTIKTQEKQIEVLQNAFNTQNMEMKTIKRELDKLRKQSTQNTEDNTIRRELKEMVANASEELLEADQSSSDKGRIIRKSLINPRLLNPQPNSKDHVAFYAYMSSHMENVGGNHQLVFDVVRTNEGNAFHPGTGVFSVPESGLYVFSWAFRTEGYTYHTVQVAVNGKTAGAIYGQVQGTDQDQSSATIVINVTEGDDVFLRTTSDHNKGHILSDHYGYTYFAGWKLN